MTARRRYREYVKKGIADGRRPELVGGGLVRSAGGWSVVKAMRRVSERMKGDERILGDRDFVETVLKVAQENLDRKSQLEAAGYSFDWLIGRVARQLEIEPKKGTRKPLFLDYVSTWALATKFEPLVVPILLAL